jgi:NitT/TauT family transport system permease protein
MIEERKLARPSRFPTLSLLVALCLLVAWELFARGGFISPIVAPAPSRIIASLISELRSGELGLHMIATVMRLTIGLSIGATIGVLGGLAMGLSPRLRRFADPFVAAAHPIPKIAILPIVMVFLGIGEMSKVAMVSLSVFFPLLINTMMGVRQISPVHFDVAKSYGATRWKLFTRVVVPAAMPMILSGLRIGLNIALVVTISVEIVTASRGLGALIWLSWETLRIEVLYATLFVTAAFGISFNLLTQFLVSRLVPWAPRSEAT